VKPIPVETEVLSLEINIDNKMTVGEVIIIYLL
jgi:hypothetical protein